MTAISTGCPSLSSITDSNVAPAIMPGIVPTTIAHASRSSVVRIARARQDADERLEVGPEVGAEIDHGADERAHVQRHVERLVQGRIVHDVPPERPRHQDQVAAARDRRKLGDPLDDAQDDGLQDGHGARVYPGAIAIPGVGDALTDGVPVTGARAARPSVARGGCLQQLAGGLGVDVQSDRGRVGTVERRVGGGRSTARGDPRPRRSCTAGRRRRSRTRPLGRPSTGPRAPRRTSP